MSAAVLISGSLFKVPEQRTSSKTGKLFVSATLKVGGDSGNDFWSLMVFSESAQQEIMRLGIGDALSAQGSFRIELYTANDGSKKISRTIFADAVLPLRQPPKERKPKAPPVGSKAADEIVKRTIDGSTDKPASSFYDEEIPF